MQIRDHFKALKQHCAPGNLKGSVFFVALACSHSPKLSPFSESQFYGIFLASLDSQTQSACIVYAMWSGRCMTFAAL